MFCLTFNCNAEATHGLRGNMPLFCEQHTEPTCVRLVDIGRNDAVGMLIAMSPSAVSPLSVSLVHERLPSPIPNIVLRTPSSSSSSIAPPKRPTPNRAKQSAVKSGKPINIVRHTKRPGERRSPVNYMELESSYSSKQYSSISSSISSSEFKKKRCGAFKPYKPGSSSSEEIPAPTAAKPKANILPANHCQFISCTKAGRYLDGEKRFCKIHAKKHMRPLNTREACQDCGIFALYGHKLPEKCAKHKLDGMEYLSSWCEYDNCNIIALFGYPNQKGVRCQAHQLPGMVNLRRVQAKT